MFISVATSGVTNSFGYSLHTCGITINNDLYCWGKNDQYELGNGTTTQSNSPIQIDSGTKYKSVAVHGNAFFSPNYSIDSISCGITLSGTLKCWGTNSKGQLGVGDFTLRSTPTNVNSVLTYKDVSVGNSMVCAQTSDNVLQCWGQVLETYTSATIQNLFF